MSENCFLWYELQLLVALLTNMGIELAVFISNPLCPFLTNDPSQICSNEQLHRFAI